MSENGTADLVFLSGAVYTVDAARRWAQAVAVREGRIVAVGTDGEIRELVGAGTEVVDLAGAMLLPGFQDAHVHPVAGGVDMLQCDLHDLGTKDEYLAAIAGYASSHPDEGWILGGGWAQDAFPRGCPDRDDLDAIVPDRPVFLPNRDGHDAWVNSKALELAGMTRDAPDPAHGRIARDPDRTPLGTVHEGAMLAVERLVPPPTADDMRAAILEGQRYLHSLGITNWQDAWVTPVEQAAYLALAGSGELTG
ncbi:MAG: amidohydrolase, partial [Planctomycetaceae bacterium]